MTLSTGGTTSWVKLGHSHQSGRSDMVKNTDTWSLRVGVGGRKPIMEIAKEVCAERGVPMGPVLGIKRRYGITEARQEIYYRCLAEGYSTTQVGKRLGKHHTTVIDGARAYAQRLEEARAQAREMLA